jgi:hypothetical protein
MHGLPCSYGQRQIVCFGYTFTGRPMTIGNYFFYPYDKGALNRLIDCEAKQKMDLLGQPNGNWLSVWHGWDLLMHESVHTAQANGFPLYSLFLGAYGAFALNSLRATGTDWMANPFETDANLWHGHYLGPEPGGRYCYYH